MSIDYVLANELKDAGFPQGGNGKWLGNPNRLVMRREDRAYVPLLEELIEECPCAIEYDEAIGYFSLLALPDGTWVAGYRDFKAFLTREIAAERTEAVARLWLVLKKI